MTHATLAAIVLLFCTTAQLPVQAQDSANAEVHSNDAASPAAGKQRNGDPLIVNGISIPSDFPLMEVRYSNNPSLGYLFLNNWGGQPYNMILDNEGNPIWYWRTPDRRRDFKLQPDGRLTMLVREGYGGGIGHIALDDTYTVVDTIRAADGYYTDEHELTVLPDGSYFLIGIREEQVDMSLLISGGNPNATVAHSVVQRFTSDGDHIWTWRPLDYLDITLTELENIYSGFFRFPHINAIDIDDDGHVLISSRHLSEVTKINKDTGAIIWRLGGYHSDFTFIDSPFNGFRNQHDIRALGNGHYTVFDNGNSHSTPESRAVEYVLDTDAMTATRVWQYRHQPAWFTPWMSNVQRLENGNTLINYADASLPKIHEVRPDGSLALEMDFVNPAHTYRAFKFEWAAVAAVPYLVLENASERVTLLFNKFGDSGVDHYNVYGGLSPNPTQIIATSAQPFIHLTELLNHETHYFRVTAVSTAGIESDYSNELSVFVNRIEPGENMVRNGDFSSGFADWIFETNGGALAFVSTETSQLRFRITRGGSEIHHVQFRQAGIPLINGKEYRFEFDAYADAPRLFEAKVGKDDAPWTNYSKINWSSLGTQSKHYSFDFLMADPSDFSARIVINAGIETADVYVDNVSLKELGVASSVDEGQPTTSVLTLHQSYPNPFYDQSGISFDLTTPQYVTLRLFNVLGQEVRTLVQDWKGQGRHSIVVESRGLPSGAYFYRLETTDALGGRSSAAGRMVHIK